MYRDLVDILNTVEATGVMVSDLCVLPRSKGEQERREQRQQNALMSAAVSQGALQFQAGFDTWLLNILLPSVFSKLNDTSKGCGGFGFRDFSRASGGLVS